MARRHVPLANDAYALIETLPSSPWGGGRENVVVSPSSGFTESRLCFRVAQATYAETSRDATAMTTPQIAITVLAST